MLVKEVFQFQEQLVIINFAFSLTGKLLLMCLGALVIERPAAIDEGFSQEAPLVYNYGQKSASANPKLYSMIIDQLAATVKERLEMNKKSSS